DPVAAGDAVHLGRDVLEDALHVGPGLRVASGHDRRSVTRALLAAGDASADEPYAGLRELLAAPPGVAEVRVAAVDDDVARLEVGEEVGDHPVDGRARLDHQHHSAGPLQGPDEAGVVVMAADRTT